MWTNSFVGFSFSVVGATYCICKDGVGDTQLQKSLDYACGAGADCTQIIQNAPCYQPNTVKDHCSYAVNSYFQKKGQAVGSCDFSGTAMTSATPPQSKSSPTIHPSLIQLSFGGTNSLLVLYVSVICRCSLWVYISCICNSKVLFFFKENSVILTSCVGDFSVNFGSFQILFCYCV